MQPIYIYVMSSPAFPPALAPAWDEYLWIVVCGGLAAFYMAWGIGANDVANSFATSVGSRTLKLWQACIVSPPTWNDQLAVNKPAVETHISPSVMTDD